MSKKLTRTSASMTVLAAFMTLLLAGAAPAFAHHATDHATGADNSVGSQRPTDDSPTDDLTTPGSDVITDTATDEDGETFTEDTDTNDDATLNNVNDDGDNAHPSGNDRSIENGASGNQGDAQSNPDDTNGPMRSEGAPGADEPNGRGGTDLADQDGNNGCGNDDDFNDDNNGNCGPRDKDGDSESEDELVIEEPGIEEVPSSGTEVLPGTDMNPSTPGTEVLPAMDMNPAAPEEDIVLGSRIDNELRVAPAVNVAAAAGTQGAVLPFTGISVVRFLMVALTLMAAGLTILRMRPGTIRNQ